jgi:thiamine-monophosphate kinase
MTRRLASESELIETYLAPLASGMTGAFGLADDAALLTPPVGSSLVLTSDPIIAGVHFLPTDRADDIAWKALAVNMSDLAAKGADPLAYMMTLAFPEPPEETWMAEFAQGLLAAQTDFKCALIGGDTDHTPGPLAIGITAFGTVPEGGFVRRQGAREGDHVFVTGTLGDAAVGLMLHRDPGLFGDALTEGERSLFVGRYLRPMPRLALALVLREHASAALDISDGFVKDVARLAGRFGLTIAFDELPVSPALRSIAQDDERVAGAILAGGDDYEILAAVAPDRSDDFVRDAGRSGVVVTKIGVLESEGPLRVLDADGQPIDVMQTGYDHLQSGSP